MGFKSIAALAAAGMAAATLGAHAQEQQQNDRPAWVKVCNQDENNDNRELCLTSQELRAEDGRFLASVAIREIEGDDSRSMIVMVPPGMLLKPGLRIQVDQNEQIPGEYAICFPNGCYAEVEANDEFVNSLKRGNQLAITTANQQGQGVNFPLTLAGFTAAYDGEPIDARQLEAQQQRLQSELQRRAEEARQKLLDQQGNAGTN